MIYCGRSAILHVMYVAAGTSRIFQSVSYGKPDFNVSIEVSAEKLAENLKTTLIEIYAYDKSCLYIYAYNRTKSMKVKLTWVITQAKEIYSMSLFNKEIEKTSTAVWLIKLI